MRLTDRQAKTHLAKAVEAAGGQRPFRIAAGLPEGRWQTALSRALTGSGPHRAELLAAAGLRLDPHTGAIHDDAPPASFRFVAVQASVEASVATATALITAVLGRGA